MNQNDFNKLIENNLELLQAWMEHNLLPSGEAMKVTEQTNNGFRQSVTSGKVKSFYKAGMTSLYLRSDLEKYRDTKRRINLKE